MGSLKSIDKYRTRVRRMKTPHTAAASSRLSAMQAATTACHRKFPEPGVAGVEESGATLVG